MDADGLLAAADSPVAVAATGMALCSQYSSLTGNPFTIHRSWMCSPRTARITGLDRLDALAVGDDFGWVDGEGDGNEEEEGSVDDPIPEREDVDDQSSRMESGERTKSVAVQRS